MDLYHEYNRLRKNLLQSIRRRGLKMPSIPTAKQLNKNIEASDIQSIKTQRQSYNLKTSTPKPKSISLKSVNVPSTGPPQKAKSQKSIKSKVTKSIEKQPKITKEKKLKSYAKIYKKYGARYTAVTEQGYIIDRQTGTEITTADNPMADEIIGSYLHNMYGGEKYKKPKGTNNPVYEFELFKAYLQERITAAFNDYNSHEYSRRGGAIYAIEHLQDKLDALSEEDTRAAMIRFEKYGDEIKNYLDVALYYTKIDNDHYRALSIVSELLSIPISPDLQDELPSAETIIENSDGFLEL